MRFGKGFIFAVVAIISLMFASPPGIVLDARAQTKHGINYISAANSSNKFTFYTDTTAATVDSVWTALVTQGRIAGIVVRYAEKDTSVLLSTTGKYVYGVQAATYGTASIVTPTIAVLDLGAPAALSTSGMKGLHKLPTTGTDTITSAITGPDVPRSISVTGNVSGITGNVYVFAPVNGVSTKITLALNGVSTVNSTVAVSGAPTMIVYPARHASGDSVKVGYGDKIGLGVALKRATVLMTIENATPEALGSVTTHVDPVSIGANTVVFANASDGNRRWVYYIAE